MRVRYQTSGSGSWTFGAYVDISTWSNSRPQATVTGLTCNTEYDFQMQAQFSNRWHDYGEFTASTGAC